MKNLIIWAVILAVATYFGAKMLLHSKVETGIDTVFLVMSPYANIEYDGISSTMGGTLTIDGVRARLSGFDDEIFIERIGIDTPSFFWLLRLGDILQNLQSPDPSMPEYFGIVAKGIHLPVNADYMSHAHKTRTTKLSAPDADTPAARCAGKYGFSPAALSNLGYEEQVISFSARFRRGVGSFVVEFTSSTNDMWAVDAEMALAGDLLNAISDGARYRPKMRELRIAYEDQSLNRRIRKYCSELGLTAADTLAAQLDTLNYFGKQNGIEFDEYIVEPYIEFLQGKSTLIITAKPSAPVSLTQLGLYKPSDVPALLELSAEAH
jgi:hypothetical protein